MTVLTLSSSDPFDPNPPEKEHGGMVINMEESYLFVLLAKDEKHLKILLKRDC